MITQWPWQQQKEIVPYGKGDSWQRAAEWLDGHGDIVDWGCGFGYFRTLLSRSKYTGVDGCNGFSDVIADLSNFHKKSNCIMMRYVLEHNWDWEKILDNAVTAFRRRMFLAISVPLSVDGKIHDMQKTKFAPDLSIPREMLVPHFQKYLVREENLPRPVKGNEYRPNEHLFCLSKEKE